MSAGITNSTGKLSVEDLMGPPHSLATTISNNYEEWRGFMQPWKEERRELLEYVFATDTRHTSAGSLDWKNSTHIPKICQIRDNLHANYMAALFPSDRPYRWEGANEDAEMAEKRSVIEAYMSNKLKQSGWRDTVSQLIYDYIDYGNVIATVENVYETRENPDTGEQEPGFIGPRAVRISMNDIVFNPAASSFEETAKIVKSITTLGALKKLIKDRPELGYMEKVFDEATQRRRAFHGHTDGDIDKDVSFSIAGFSSWLNYFNSDYVEVLDFYGDVYDRETGEIHTNCVITVIDRRFVIRNEPNPSWHTSAPFFHTGWRKRPDNLVAMGPLDNLVGMQYRIDHLENSKADAFDLIIHPVMKIVGDVEEFEYRPGSRIYVGDEGDVTFMPPDTTMLNADTQIMLYENKMEEMAGAPKQAMGFRTPGEKTKYEVQVLENGANRVFINKAAHFEETFLEPLLNAMLISARQNIAQADMIRVVDDATGAIEFLNITPEDLKASGKLTPTGARHFARDANMLQSLTTLSGSPMLQDPLIKNHFSGYKIAKLLENLLGVERFELVERGVGVSEEMEMQQQVASAQQVLGEQQAIRTPSTEGPPVNE